MAGRIPQSFINDLLGRVDIVDVIDARIQLKKAGKNYQALCPFHNEKTPSFSVAPDKQFYHCFGCGVSGTALTFLMEHDRLEFPEAVETLARLVGVEVPREGGGRRTPQQNQQPLYEVLERAGRHFRSALRSAPQAVDYLKGRGLTGVVARDFGIGWAADEWQGLRGALPDVPEKLLLDTGLLTRSDRGRSYDRFRGRIMFPIRDTRGRIIGFGGRQLADGDGPKYLNSPETPLFHKGRELYGLYEARKALRQIDRLLVVEGYLDVVALAQAGISNSVAALGTAATAEHFQKLWRYTREVVCCFDGDAAGRQAAWRALENALPTLTEDRQLKFMFLPEGEDPDSLVRAQGRDAFLERVGNAVPALEYLFQRLSAGLDLSRLDDRARLAGLVMPLAAKVPAGILQQLMRQRLAQLTGLEAAAPAAAAARLAPAAAERPAPLRRLDRQLLGMLLREPALVRRLDGDRLARLRATDSGDLWAQIANYLAENPDADTDQVLGRWSGEGCHRELVAAAARPLALSGEALALEFVEGVDRYLTLQARDQRQQLLAELRQAPSLETLERYWQHKNPDESAEKLPARGNSESVLESK